MQPQRLAPLQKKLRYAELSRNLMESPPTVTRRWPLLQHLVLSRNPLKGRHHQSRRLLRAAQKGHEAMHRGVSHYVFRRMNASIKVERDGLEEHFLPRLTGTGTTFVRVVRRKYFVND